MLRWLVKLVAVAGCGLAAAGVAQPCGGQVRINEILADPGRDWDGDGQVGFKEDEWVEIVNAGTSVAVLDGMRLSDGGSVAFRFGFSGTLAPGATLVVHGSDSVAWESAHGLSTVGLSLNNAGDSVRLWRLAGSDTVLVDAHTYAAHAVLDDRSTGRLPDGTGEWRVFDAYLPYTGSVPPLGTGCPPTPGAPNACPTAVEPATWTAIKELYEGSGTPAPELR